MNKKDWIEKVQDFAEEKSLFSPGAKLVLAVSGGVDSMVLLDLLAEMDAEVIVAHCNFGLRGEESDADEAFVGKRAKEYGLPFFSTRFDTDFYAAENKFSIQEAARNLRYEWLEKIRRGQNADAIATAHHRNDTIETLLLNLVKGTGIQGLTGIPVKNGHVVRPLLFAFREEIEAYAKQEGISWREDSSNASDKYRRNVVRNRLIPLMKEINPSVERTLSDTITRMEQVNRMYQMAIHRMKNELVHYDEALGCFKISLLEMAGRQVTTELFFELVRDFDFNAAQAEDMLEACFSHAGKQFYSPTHQALVDRVFILIREKEEETEAETYMVEESDLGANKVPYLQFEILDIVPADIPADTLQAYLDYEKLQFPLTIRRWQPGDSFVPFGMKGKKKISDFLTGLKLSRMEKENVQVLLSGNQIAWVIGYRVSDRFKVTGTTQKLLAVRRTENI